MRPACAKGGIEEVPVVLRQRPDRPHRTSDDRTAMRPEAVPAAEHEAADEQEDDGDDRVRRPREARCFQSAVGTLRADDLTARWTEGGAIPDLAADCRRASSSYKLTEISWSTNFARNSPSPAMHQRVEGGPLLSLEPIRPR